MSTYSNDNSTSYSEQPLEKRSYSAEFNKDVSRENNAPQKYVNGDTENRVNHQMDDDKKVNTKNWSILKIRSVHELVVQLGSDIFKVLGVFLIALVGAIWLVYLAFRVSFIWGLGILIFYPIVGLIFSLMHWQEAKKPFFIAVFGALAIFSVSQELLGVPILVAFPFMGPITLAWFTVDACRAALLIFH